MANGSVFARVHALVVCDEVAPRPGEEGVYDLFGVRVGLRAASFPHTHPQLCVYLQVSGHEGTVSARLVAVREATEEEIVYIPIEAIHLRGPLTLVPVWLRVRDCVFPGPGVYWFQVVVNEKLVQERRFHLVEVPSDTNGQPF
jgi:hypothetical protein